ncbi:MAG TPA: hypothetical protein VGQ52_13785 [Gemmatimonadaceae bacterium]|jgi:hypothetical protein|nr:hypothetical protein [Gemmatimonadaceae bacterium]
MIRQGIAVIVLSVSISGCASFTPFGDGKRWHELDGSEKAAFIGWSVLALGVCLAIADTINSGGHGASNDGPEVCVGTCSGPPAPVCTPGNPEMRPECIGR